MLSEVVNPYQEIYKIATCALSFIKHMVIINYGVEILEIQTHSVNAQNSVQGAIRKLNFFINQLLYSPVKVLIQS